MATIKQTIVFKANPHDVYEALMDSAKHAAFTGAPARVSRKVGGAFTVYDDWIRGKNIDLVPDKKIVQFWHAHDDEWPKGHESRVTFIFAKIPEGTKLVFTHEDVPDDWVDELSKGWEDYYWKPMKVFLRRC